MCVTFFLGILLGITSNFPLFIAELWVVIYFGSSILPAATGLVRIKINLLKLLDYKLCWKGITGYKFKFCLSPL